MRFEHPALLGLLVVVAGLAFGYAIAQRRRGRYALEFSDTSLLDSVAPHRPGWRRHLVAAAFLVVLTVLVATLAGPVRDRDVPRERALVILTLDTSFSMGSTDVEPSRIGAAKDAARSFLDGAPPGVDVGLIALGPQLIELRQLGGADLGVLVQREERRRSRDRRGAGRGERARGKRAQVG